jgi:hypothetical protein
MHFVITVIIHLCQNAWTAYTWLDHHPEIRKVFVSLVSQYLASKGITLE